MLLSLDRPHRGARASPRSSRIAGYYFYLLYWLAELPAVRRRAAGTAGADLPRVLVQIPVYNEPLVVERALAAAGGARLAARPAEDPAARRQHRPHLGHRRPRRRRLRKDGIDAEHVRRVRSQRLQGGCAGGGHGALRRALRRGVRRRLRGAAGLAAPGDGGDARQPTRRLRADAHRMGQRRAQLADPRAAPDAGRPFRRRAGRAGAARPAVPVQRHRRDLAPRRGGRGRRLVA